MVTVSSSENLNFQIIYTTNYYHQAGTNYFDAAGRVVTNVNALGEKTITRMDALGRTTSTLVYNAASTLAREKYFAYSADHNSVTVTDGSGASAISHTTWTDTAGHTVLSIAYPSTSTTEFTLNQYDLAGNLIAAQHDSSANGIMTIWSTNGEAYDGLNRLIRTVDRDGATTTYAYDSLGDLTNRTLPGGLQWAATYTNSGLELQDWLVGTNGAGTRTNTYTYFAAGSPFAGLVNTKTDGRGLVSAYLYDGWLRQISVVRTDPNYNYVTTSWGYDPRGYVTNITEQYAANDAANNPKTILRTYDPYGQMSSETIKVGGSVFSEANQMWDAAGRRTGLNLNGTSYGFASRADGALIGASAVSGNGSYAYDTAGMLTNRIVGSRTSSITSRDGEGRPNTITTSVNGASLLTESLVWNNDGTMASDTLARPDFTDSRLYSYANLSRRLAQEQLNINGTSVWTNNFSYDSGTAGGPGVLTSAGQSGSALWTGGINAFSAIGVETNNVATYPATGRVNGQSTLNATLDGAPLTVTTNSTGDATHPYRWYTTMELTPGAHQLKVAAAHPSGFFTAGATNWFTNNIGSQNITISRDGSGNIMQRIWRDPNGTNVHQQTLYFDGRDRPADIYDLDSAQNGYYLHSEYDGLNRRLFSTCTVYTNGQAVNNSQVVINQYYDPLVEFLELGVSYGGLTEWKLYGPDLNGQYGGMNGVGGLDGVTTYLNQFVPLISDFRGDIMAGVTNNAVAWNPSRPTGYGAVPGYRPVALGHGAGISLSSTWRGRWVDITGCYQIGMRMYDPIAGMWLSYDPTWNQRDPNYLSFCGGDPINGFDSDGRCFENAAGKTMTGLYQFLFSASNEEDAQPLDEQIAAKYDANYKYYGNNSLYALNATFNPAVSTALSAGETFGGRGLNYYNSGQTLNYSQQVDAGGNMIVGFGQTTATAATFYGAGALSVNAANAYLTPTFDAALPSTFSVAGSDSSVSALSASSEIPVTSPNAAARASVQGEYIDPLTNQKVTTSEKLAADHIVPQDTIKTMVGFNFLTQDEANQVLNNPNNFQGLPKSFNSSKGAKSAAEWTTYKGQPLNPNYVQRNQQLENTLQQVLQQQIMDLLNGN